jgi:hypothetical protein
MSQSNETHAHSTTIANEMQLESTGPRFAQKRRWKGVNTCRYWLWRRLGSRCLLRFPPTCDASGILQGFQGNREACRSALR